VGRLLDAGAKRWAPRVGLPATRLRVASDLLNLAASTLTLLFLLLLGIGVAVKSDAVVGLGVAVECCAIALWVVSLSRRSQYRRVASEHLGVRVSGRVGENVPRDKGRYEDWCREKGLTPYAAE
jgi:hypothetical protein